MVSWLFTFHQGLFTSKLKWEIDQLDECVLLVLSQQIFHCPTQNHELPISESRHVLGVLLVYKVQGVDVSAVLISADGATHEAPKYDSD